MALRDTALKKQALRVHGFARKRNEVQLGSWRQVGMALEDDSMPHKQATLDALDKLEQGLLQEQRSAAQPKTRHYELAPE